MDVDDNEDIYKLEELWRENKWHRHQYTVRLRRHLH